jgi:D-sedoheptulose 7-phosphate isomerase
MSDRKWLAERFAHYQHTIFAPEILDDLVRLKDLLEKVRVAGKKVIFAGNGGSAALASHCAVDFAKSARIRAVNFNEASLITCLANDYGYERWLEEALRIHADDGDMVILISSSGRSPNMIRAAEYSNARELLLVTFTGWEPDNRLRSLGQLNFWVPSRVYNIIEMTHHIWLLAVCDLLMEKEVAFVKPENEG